MPTLSGPKSRVRILPQCQRHVTTYRHPWALPFYLFHHHSHLYLHPSTSTIIIIITNITTTDHIWSLPEFAFKSNLHRLSLKSNGWRFTYLKFDINSIKIKFYRPKEKDELSVLISLKNKNQIKMAHRWKQLLPMWWDRKFPLKQFPAEMLLLSVHPKTIPSHNG